VSTVPFTKLKLIPMLSDPLIQFNHPTHLIFLSQMSLRGKKNDFLFSRAFQELLFKALPGQIVGLFSLILVS